MHLKLIGPDGSGKSTQLKLLLDLFPEAVLTREPGGTPEAEIIREVLLSTDITNEQRINKISSLTKTNAINDSTRRLLKKALSELSKGAINGTAEMYLYTASRSESINNVILPTLKERNHVIGNRSVACSVAYQGNARGLGMELVWKVNEPIVKNAYPDLELFLDIPISTTMERLALRAEKQDRFDTESAAFHQKTREGYLHFYNELCPYTYKIIDATGSIENVHRKIVQAIKSISQ